MWVKPAQAELNAGLKPIFSHVPNVYLIHDGLIITTKSSEQHLEAIREVMQVIKSKNPFFDPNKCTKYKYKYLANVTFLWRSKTKSRIS